MATPSEWLLPKRGGKLPSASIRAGLLFPVTRIRRYLKAYFLKWRIGYPPCVYLAAVLEYLAAEVLELAGGVAREEKRVRIGPRHIMLAMFNDDELFLLLKKAIIPSAGVAPNILPQLLKNKKSSHFWNEAPVPTKPPRAKKAKIPKTQQIPERVQLMKSKSAQLSSAGERMSGSKDAETGLVILMEKYVFVNRQRITVEKGDPTRIACEGLVAAADSQMQLLGDDGAQVLAAGGPVFAQHLRHLYDADGHLDVAGAAIATASGALSAHFILLSHVPDARLPNATNLLEKSLVNILKLADLNELRRITICSLDTKGESRFSKTDIVRHVLLAIKHYFENTFTSYLKQIYVVTNDNELIGNMLAELATFSGC